MARSMVAAYLGLVAGVSLVGLVVVAVIDGTTVGRASRSVPEWLAARRTGVLDVVAAGSSLTDEWTVVALVVGASGMLVATGHRRHALLPVLGLVLEVAVHLTTSAIVGRGRPDVDVAAGSGLTFTPAFPSGHVAVAIVVYGALAVVVSSLVDDPGAGRVMAALVVVVVAVVAFARVYVGVHDVLDVGGGVLLGLGVLAATRRAVGPLGPPEPPGGPG